MFSGYGLMFGQQANRYLSFTQGFQQYTDHINTLPLRETLNGEEQFYQIGFSFSGATISAIMVEDTEYEFLHIDGFGKMGQVGAPALPAHREVIAMPPGSVGDIVITGAEYYEYDGFRIHPALEPARDTYGSPEPEFWADPAVYGNNAFFPEKTVEITNIMLLRGTPLALTEIRPVQFNPVTGKVRVYTSISFRIEYKGASQSFSAIADGNSLHFTNLLKRNEINSDNIPDGMTRGDSKAGEKEYIIITHSQYINEANQLANWKRQLGYSVEVVSQSSWTAAQVKTAIETRYDSWNPKPDYFLIIGDHTGSYAVPGEIHQDPSYGDDFATDLYFACMDGGTDWHPDMAHGRISVSSVAEAQVVVNKIINYEKTPPTQSSFYSNILNCAEYQDEDENGGAGNGYADRRFCHTSENIRDYLQGSHGYTSTRVYYRTGTANVTGLRYNNGYYSNGQLLPSELRSTSFNWTGGSTDITNAINAGKFMVFHRDHGYVGGSGWAHPYYTTSTMANLTNGSLLPVVFSMNCHTGEFQLSNCFSEKFLRMENKGAVGVIGAAYYSYSGYNDALSIGMIDAIWATPGVYPVFGSGGTGANYTIGAGNEIYTMGDVMNQGLYAMEQNWNGSSSANNYQYELFHYFGDPAMKIWTENPNNNVITATHSSTIDCELTSFSITGSAPYAVATLVFNDEIIGETTLNASGVGTITYSIPGPGSTVILTISKTNHKPYITSLIIVGSCNPPSMQTDPATDVGQTTATLNGEILAPNGTVTESGFVYSISGNPVIGGPGVTQTQTSPLVTNGVFSVPVTGLSLATNYYVKAYAISDGGTGYGDEVSFITNDGLPVVATDPATSVTSNAATLNGEIIDNNGTAITESGFVYSLTSDPVLGGSGVTAVQTSPLITNGTYSIPASGLTPASTYYVKAYAINSIGTGYGSEESFTTNCGIINALPYIQEFTTYSLPACWENIDNEGNGQVWQFNYTGLFLSTTAGNGYALLNSDAYGSGYTQDADLVTPEFDFSEYQSVNLYFELYFRDYQNESGSVLYSTNGGSTWTQLQQWTEETSNPEVFNQDVTTQVAGESSVKFKWNYTGTWGYYFFVDDVHITGVEAPSSVNQTIPLTGGWNILSFYVAPPDANMMTIVQPLINGGNLVKISDEGGGFIQYIAGSWMNTIGDMENTEGYYINVSGTPNLSVDGAEISFPFDIPLSAGWNIMGYPCDVSQSAMTVLQPLIDNNYLVKVIDESGGFIQYITGLGWMNSINDFEPGEGYYINVNSNCTLSISDPGKGTNPYQKPQQVRPLYFASFTSNPYSPMNVVIRNIETDGFTIENGDEIAVYDGDVEVGSLVILDDDAEFILLALRADDPLTPSHDGFNEGGILKFRYWDKSENLLYTDIETMHLFGNKNFTKFGTYGTDLKIGSLGIDDDGLPGRNFLGQNFPNPFNDNTIIVYGLSETAHVKISVHDISGRTVSVLEDAIHEAGIYQTRMDASLLESGIYYYRLVLSGSGPEFSATRKMVLCR